MTFYRLHRADAPQFSASNAWSGIWGSTFSEDGSRARCESCSGSGRDFFDAEERCTNCGGEGWFDCDRGYSCCDSGEELVEYFDRHGDADDTDPVVVFDGNVTGTGCDGEPLVVPTHVVRWTTFGQLRAELAA